MPRKLKFINDAIIADKPYSIYLDEETGQKLSIPHDVAQQAAFDPISVVDREDSKLRAAQHQALEAQRLSTPPGSYDRVPMATANFGDMTPREDPLLQKRDRLQSVIDEFERNRQAEILRRRDALLNRPPLTRQLATSAGPTDEMSPGNRMGSFADVISELRRRAGGR